uniref:Prefoldin subunit 4 n=1 Tax=Fibrocapsa japonica TaxID=94617 RepID=A0A7S2V806_9STRA|mmetsp:Transcript_7272/g.10918  ORF Transcript_7272/g.10918 Transcript_7272/m.10918 type:complete len:130 (+) Transcript_7272:104-493(+)
MAMISKDQDDDVLVRWEDQQKINEFGRLNTRLHELQVELKLHKENLDKLDDASTELMTEDGSGVKLLLGEVFIECNEDYATEYLDKEQEKTQVLVDQLSEEEHTILERQKELKEVLYARFGSSINLEDK